MGFVIKKFFSRKFIAFAVCSAGMFLGFIESHHFVAIAGIYVGGQSAVDSVDTWASK